MLVLLMEFMICGIEMASCGMMFLPSFMKIVYRHLSIKVLPQKIEKRYVGNTEL
jgi:hypothetical protein